MKKVILTTLIALIAVPAFAATQGDATARFCWSWCWCWYG